MSKDFPVAVVYRAWWPPALALIAVFLTFLVASVYQTDVVVDDGLELWYINSTDGWSLGVPAHDSVILDHELVTKIAGIAKINGKYVVKRDNGQLLVVSREGFSWHIEDHSPSSGGFGTMGLRIPRNLRAVAVIRKYWWLFGAEGLAGVTGIAGALTFACRRRKGVPPDTCTM